MRTLTKLSALAILAASAIACGGDGGEVEQRECGPGTYLVDGQCEVDESNCGAGSILNDEGQCEPTGEICGENTTYDAGQGRCVPNIGIQCAEGTIEVDGECVPEDAVECAEGTVVANNQCVPADDICGDGTEPDNQDRCRPTDEVCGEGTSFDVATRTCVPTSLLSCGAGTIQIDGTCRLRAGVVADLAATATLNLDEAGETPIDLVSGEALVFTGNIDAPELSEGEYVQDLDTLLINGTPGQWIRVAIHANGMPEPGFVFMEEVAEPANPEAEEPPAPFSRTSDAGAGLDFSREIVIPNEGVYALNVGPIAQLLELAGPAGGEDWGYVGSIELIDAPTPTAVEFPQDAISGDIRNLTENFYEVSGVAEGDQFVFFLNQVPSDAQAEVQIWTDATTLAETITIDGGVIIMNAPAESFFLLVDRVYSDGPATLYDAQPYSSQTLDGEASITETITLAAGEYITISQWNGAEANLSASISAGGEALVESSALRPRTATSGTRALQWFAFEETEVTVTFENTSEDTLEGVVVSIALASAIDLGEVAPGAAPTLSRALPAETQSYLTFETTELINWTIALQGNIVADFELIATDGSLITEAVNTALFRAGELAVGRFLLKVTPADTVPANTAVQFEVSTVFEQSLFDVAVNSPSENNIVATTTSTITVPQSCQRVGSIEVYVTTNQGTWQDELTLKLTSPASQTVRLFTPSSTTSSPLDRTFPTLHTPVDSMDVFVGQNAPGDWTLEVEYTWSNSGRTLPEWRLTIDCVE
ncbi:hypothetical protein DV096_17570 [Bradymonadaceae bacterium TMQ3]|nr:hypothetical protein DV096_17570 [Bradymonadaceae bacterium TMQ3]TXC69515.1 hypothetical protein FRC91_18150 [Bradymonadales bacterium TMQ1]